jgi:hypothetical protein
LASVQRFKRFFNRIELKFSLTTPFPLTTHH